MISIRERVTKEIVDIMVFITVNDNNDYTPYYSALWATREAHNPNVQVAIIMYIDTYVAISLKCWSKSIFDLVEHDNLNDECDPEWRY